MHLVCILSELWTCLHMFFNHVLSHQKAILHLTSHTNADSLYVSKFKHYNYRYLVPILIFLSRFALSIGHSKWNNNLHTCPSLNRHRHSGHISLDILHTYCTVLICSHIFLNTNQTNKNPLIRALKF